MAKPIAETRSLVQAKTVTAIRVLAGIMRSPKSSPTARIAAAIALLDRGWGKPS